MNEDTTRKLNIDASIQARQDSDLPSLGESNALIGSIVDDRYRVEHKLGEGGMSTVYRVHHISMHAPMALKVMQRRLVSDDQSVRRFIQEAQAVSRLRHPNVITVHDTGVTGTGQPYIVMDHLTGSSLADLLKDVRYLERVRAIDIFVQICNGIAAAHAMGIVHRDLKPSNIIIQPHSDGEEQAIVLDFGIAKVMEADEAVKVQLTQTGEVFGSPLYMSPEQCTGDRVDSRSDIYSLGCVMYECLTGQPPFAGATVYDTIHRQVSELPRRFASVRPELSGVDRLESIVLRCLSKSPNDRYQSMLEVRNELLSVRNCSQATLAGTLSTLRQLIILETKRLFTRSNTAFLLAGAVVASLVFGAVASSIWMALPFSRLEAAPIENSWDLKFSSDFERRTLSRKEELQVLQLQEFVRIASLQMKSVAYRVRKQEEFADACYRMGAIEFALPMYRRLVGMIRDPGTGMTVQDKLKHCVRLGDLLYANGEIPAASVAYQRAAGFLVTLTQFEAHANGPLYARMAHCIASLGGEPNLELSLPLAKAAVQIQVGQNSGLELMKAETVLADIERKLGHIRKNNPDRKGESETKQILLRSEERYKRLAQGWNKSPLISPRNVGLALFCQGLVLRDLGREAEAADIFKAAEPYIKTSLGEDDARMSILHRERADALWNSGDYPGALVERFRAKLM